MAGSEEKQKGEGGDDQKPKLLTPQFSLAAGQPSLNTAVRAASLPCPSHHAKQSSPIWSLRVLMGLEQTRGAHPAAPGDLVTQAPAECGCGFRVPRVSLA